MRKLHLAVELVPWLDMSGTSRSQVPQVPGPSCIEWCGVIFHSEKGAFLMPSNILWYQICNHLQPSTTSNFLQPSPGHVHLLDVEHEALQLDVEHRWKTLEANALGNQDVIICGYVVVVFHQHLSYTTNRCQVKFGSSPKKIKGINQQILNMFAPPKTLGFCYGRSGVSGVVSLPKKKGLTESATAKKFRDLSSSLLSMRFCIIGIVTLPIFLH